MPTLSRRDFLQSLSGVFAAAILPKMPDFNLGITDTALVPIPPSLMLHSPHGRGTFLANLLPKLKASGFTATTYKAWLASVKSGNLIEKPLLISIDDLTLSQDVTYAWETFSAMQQVIQDANMVATFGVITTPVIGGVVCRQQDQRRWDLMADWVSDGFELATHTTFHSCFSNKYSLPRNDFAQTDYDVEICESAELIESQLQTRGIDYQVETLILPYGSGYSYAQPQPKVHDGIVNACRKTNVRAIAGIPQGQAPLERGQIRSQWEQLYMGRLNPAVSAEKKLDIANTVKILEQWSQRNAAFITAHTPPSTPGFKHSRPTMI